MESEEKLLAAPIQFKRMLSWQLSTPTAAPIAVKKKRKKKKSRDVDNVLSSSPGDDLSLGDDRSDEEEVVDCPTVEDCDDKTAEYAYVYVNSDGEEEVYYSAPESPLTSDDESSPVAEHTTAGDSEILRECGGHRSKKSKKKKKKARYLARVAKAEFFQPLCDLVEDKLQVEVGQLELSSCAQVPNLAEICIKKIRSDAGGISESLPFLIHSLLSHDKEQRASVAIHVRWLERLLAVFEKQTAIDIQNWKKAIANGYKPDTAFLGRAFTLQSTWNLDAGMNELPNEGDGLHLPLASIPDQDHLLQGHDTIVAKILLHFTNYFLPRFSNKKSKILPVELSGSLSPSQLAAIHYVNDFIQTRYKSLSTEWSEFLKVWPGYVYWARGQLKLAANAFVYSLNLLTHANDKACILNELGRMFLLFGDRTAACRYYRQAALTAQPDEQNCFVIKHHAIQLSAFAMEASIWDCGLLSPSTAREAARAWSLVIKEASAIAKFPWYLHAAACESRLCFHSVEPVGEDPNSPLATASSTFGRHTDRESSTLQWLKECESLISDLVESHPVLYYYLSVVAALSGEKDSSRTAWRHFINEYYGFHEWPSWIPSNTSVHIFSNSVYTYHPWQSLLDMLTKQRLKCAPVMKIHWRVRLLQPYYPYFSSSLYKSLLADHCATPPGLRFTSDGYLTGDFNLDMPPMRCVLIDPYTGVLHFSQSSSLQHYNLHQFLPAASSSDGNNIRFPDKFSLPWPLQVFESERCVVELLLTSTTDLESSELPESNYHAFLHWYGHGKTQGRLNVRKLIRKELKQKIMKLAEKMELEDKEALLDKLMDLGRHVSLSDLKCNFKAKYMTQKGDYGNYKRRNNSVYDFHLILTYHTVFAESTLAMCFNLNPVTTRSDHIYGQALMFVDCSSLESFSKPKIYCVGDHYGYQHIYPSLTSCSIYQNNHFKHLRHIMAVCSESTLNGNKKAGTVGNTQLVFDWRGNIVHSHQIDMSNVHHYHQLARISEEKLQYLVSLGNRLFTWKKLEGSNDIEVFSYNMKGEDEIKSKPLEANFVHQFTAIPGLLFLNTDKGVTLLDPETLEPVDIKAEDPTSTAIAGDTVQYQFKVDDVHFSILKVWQVVAYSRSCSLYKEDLGVQNDNSESKGAAELVLSENEDLTGTQSQHSYEGAVGNLTTLSTEDNCDFYVHKRDLESAHDVGISSGADSETNLRDLGFGSCMAAFTVDNRLIVIKVESRNELNVYVLLDILLPGKTTELHPMGNTGYMVSVTHFPDHFREEIYWLSEFGQLLGVLPALGKGPRGFLSATLDKSSKSSRQTTCSVASGVDDDDDDDGGLYVFFNDGMGGIACLRPTV